MPTDPQQPTPGSELAAARRLAGFLAREVAERAGMSRSRLAALELLAVVQPPTARRVFKAIDDLTTERRQREAQR
jgi:transcriptional regulator with XRE-family HTH domain